MTVLMLLAFSAQVYAQATCGGPCGGFNSSGVTMNVNEQRTFTTTYTSGVTWSVSSGLQIMSSSAGSITIKALSAGTRSLCLTYNANGVVCAVCKVITVVECPASPVLGLMYEYGANPPVVKVTANVYNGSYSYVWYVNGVLHAGPQNGMNQIALPPTCGMIYQVTVTITSPSGCSRSSQCKRFYFDCGSMQPVDNGPCQFGGGVESVTPEPIETKPKKELSVYPNPASGTVNLSFEDEGVRTIEVVDAAGNVVLSKVVSGTEYSMDVTEFKKGQYYVRQRKGTGKESVSRLLIE